jgi:hypothetical protein
MSNLPTDNDNQLINNILQDIQDGDSNPESVYNRTMDDSINIGNTQQLLTPQEMAQQQYHQQLYEQEMLPPAPIETTKGKINYVKYLTLFLLFVIVFVGLTHPKVFGLLKNFKFLVGDSTPNIFGTLLLSTVGGLLFVALQHFVL